MNRKESALVCILFFIYPTEDDSYTDFSIVKKQDMAEGENILVSPSYIEVRRTG